MPPSSLYLHIPFCKTKCPYCDFASWSNKEDFIDQYFDALISEIKIKCEVYNTPVGGGRIGNSRDYSLLRTVFIGGGTPSLVHPDYYKKLFSELKKYFKISKDCEITLELNPGTAQKEYLLGYKQLGINRISIGAQSFNENILETLGRKHTIDETLEAISLVKECGFDNFNLDLIYAVPGMTEEIWTSTIHKALDLNPKHISSYSLTIEPNTPFEHIYKNPNSVPDGDFASDLYFELCNILKEKGFNHYEISNFSRPGFESKHNLNYWIGNEFYAFGVNAHRYLNGLRTSNTKELETYMSNPSLEIINDFPIDYNFEKIMLNSRLNQGFEVNLLNKISKKNQFEITETIKDLSNLGYLELLDNRIHLTDKGMFVNNEILLRLI